MSMPMPPPDTREAGQPGHITDHNVISDSLQWLGDAVSVLQQGQASAAQVIPGWESVRAHGAAGDGVTDDTAAITAATSAAVAAGHGLLVPAGTYIVSDTIDWTADHLHVSGAGMYLAFITQATANKPAVHVGGHYQDIGGLTIGYTSQRPSGEASSISLTLGKNGTAAVNSRYHDLSLKNGQTGLARDPACTASVPAFSSQFANIRVDHWSQSAIRLDSPAGMSTGCTFSNVYCTNGNGTASAGTSASYPVYLDNWTEGTWDQLNVESSSLTTSAIFVGHCGSVAFRSVHVEGNIFSTGNTGIFELGGNQVSSVTVDALTFQLCNIAAGITFSLATFTSAWSMAVIIDGLWLNQLALGSGASLYVANFGSQDGCRAWLRTASVTAMGFFTGLATGGLSHCAAFWNAKPAGALGPPAVPGTTVAYTNAYRGHAMVYVTAGSAATTVAVDGSVMAVLPASQVGTFHIPAGSTITLTYASGSPSWAWYGIP